MKLLRGFGAVAIGGGTILFLFAGKGIFAGPVGLMVGAGGACLLCAVGGVLLAKSFLS